MLRQGPCSIIPLSTKAGIECVYETVIPGTQVCCHLTARVWECQGCNMPLEGPERTDGKAEPDMSSRRPLQSMGSQACKAWPPKFACSFIVAGGIV